MKTIRDHKKKSVADQTWKKFKKYFADEYHELKRMQRTNAGQAVFQSVNAEM